MSASQRATAVFGIKVVHSLAFWIIQSSILYMLWKGFRHETDRGVAVTAGIALAESAIYAANGFRCPLTKLAEDLGSEHGAVTDIFLPDWLASNIARIYTPMLACSLWLHASNIVRLRRSGTPHA